MSKTVDDLVKVFMQAADDTYAAEYIDPADTTNVAWRAGIAAVIMALRDEFGRIMYPGDDWNRQGILEQFDQILGSDAGNEKVAGVSVGNGETELDRTSGPAPATDPAPAVCDIKELVKRLRSEEWATVEREQTRNAAADALEALAAERDRLKAALVEQVKQYNDHSSEGNTMSELVEKVRAAIDAAPWRERRDSFGTMHDTRAEARAAIAAVAEWLEVDVGTPSAYVTADNLREQVAPTLCALALEAKP